jgi:CheY-like chemotaxis protein
VSDTGEGMDEATLSRATEPFFTTKGVGKGTGLGLSMIHGLAEQSGGKLVLRSKRGAGTTAEIFLPVATSADAPAEIPRAEAPPEMGPRTVLAVDDDLLVLMNTSFMLEDQGHTVLTASSGRKALEMLQAGQRVDLVIADQAMPGMTGSELSREIAAKWPDLPVILATGYAELPPSAQPKVKLAKPFGPDDLARAIGRAEQTVTPKSRDRDQARLH